MGSYLVAVMTNPRDGMEDEYLDHYENTHLDEVLATTACTSAQHFRLDAQKGAPAAHGYLALYEVEADSARFSMSIENIPTDNPKTGRITALSVISALSKITAPLRVGT